MALVLDRQDRARLEESLSAIAQVTFCETCEELYRLATAPGVWVVVTEPFASRHMPTAGIVRRIKIARPELPVLGYCEPTARHSSDIIALAHAGVDELLFRRSDDYGPALIRTCESAVRQCVASYVYERLSPRIPASARAAVQYCLHASRAAFSVNDLASGVGVPRRTLVYRLSREGLPPPRTVIAWCRLLLATRLLEDYGRTVTEVAGMLEFSSESALRNMFRRHTSLRPKEVRDRGGLGYAIDLFAAEIVRRPALPPERSDQPKLEKIRAV